MPSMLNSTAIGPSGSKVRIRLNLLALDERLHQVGERDVIAAGREPDRSVRWNVEAVFQFEHLVWTQFSVFISWISTVAKSAEPPVSLSGVAPLLWTTK